MRNSQHLNQKSEHHRLQTAKRNGLPMTPRTLNMLYSPLAGMRMNPPINPVWELDLVWELVGRAHEDCMEWSDVPRASLLCSLILASFGAPVRGGAMRA
mmetsp:Transcript_117749/g.333173  ORF Transcript_117749/g.333173 Transcript_117749/m.333173 type:complete len:99 (-) Transcript_117749:228-524(-)